MFIPRKGTRLGLVSRGKALVQLAALPKTNVRGILTMHACGLLVVLSNERGPGGI